MDHGVMLETCIALAVEAHRGQRDKAGQPYILHPLRVMAAVRARHGSITQQAAAVLHDVVEDSQWTLSALREAGVPEDVLVLVDALTHPKGEPDDVYLERVTGIPGAALVKESDVLDNIGRLIEVTDPATRERLAVKYRHALTILRREA